MSFSAASFIFKKVLPAAATLVAGSALLFSEPLRYAGSDFLSGEPDKALSAAIEKTLGEKPLSALRGSISGEKELRSGEADFAFLFLPSGGKNIPEVKNGEWRVIPLAYQVAYVAVAAANPIEQITFTQLAAIFGHFSTKTAQKWADVGVDNFSAALIPCVGDPSKTNAVSFFQSRVLPRYTLRSAVRSFISDTEAFKDIINNPGVIAIVGSLPPSDAPIKTISVADTTDDPKAPAYAPMFTNIYNGDYPLTIPLYVVYPTQKRLELKPILSFLYSQEMATPLKKAGFLELAPKLREQFQKGIDNIK